MLCVCIFTQSCSISRFAKHRPREWRERTITKRLSRRRSQWWMYVCARKELSLVHTGMCIRCCCFFLPKGNEKIRNTSGKYVCVLWWWWWETATNNNTTSSCRSQQPTDCGCGTRHAEPNPGSGRSIFCSFPLRGKKRQTWIYFGRLFKNSGPNESCHTHTHNSGCISHHTPTWFVVLLRYCMKVNQNGRAFYEIKYSMGPTPKNNFFHFFVVVYTCRVLCSILSIRVGILVSGDVAEQDDFRWGWKGEPGRKQV
jgi:hypothetical protein